VRRKAQEALTVETVTFVPELEVRQQAAEAFAFREAQLERWLPFAEIEHIGSTAIRGALTKGDLDVLVRVSETDFRVAEEVLSGLFARNEGTARMDFFASFKDESARPPLGIQLVVRGTEWDVFSRFRDHRGEAPPQAGPAGEGRRRTRGDPRRPRLREARPLRIPLRPRSG
jgi:GrpB-like predicted nucleotidyltransferase (UPF0157 family)